MKIPIFKHVVIKPLSSLGLTGAFWGIHIDTLIYTWISMAIIFAIVIAARFYYTHKTVNPFSFVIEQMIEFFVTLCKDSFGFFNYDYFSFITSLFVFTVVCNAAGTLPFVSEPTEEINTALACGICAFAYVQYQKIKIQGLLGYLKEYFQPIFILFPLNLVGELAKVASMSFRLFGNILGGSIIVLIVVRTIEPIRSQFMLYVAISIPLMWLVAKIPTLSRHPIVQKLTTLNNFITFGLAYLLIFFSLFEGVIQAFVITMLTITYLSLIERPENQEELA